MADGKSNPFQGGAGGPKAPPFLPMHQSNPQGNSTRQAQQSGSQVPGGPLPQTSMPTPAPTRQAQQGAGTLGNGSKPFQIRGG